MIGHFVGIPDSLVDVCELAAVANGVDLRSILHLLKEGIIGLEAHSQDDGAALGPLGVIVHTALVEGAVRIAKAQGAMGAIRKRFFSCTLPIFIGSNRILYYSFMVIS